MKKRIVGVLVFVVVMMMLPCMVYAEGYGLSLTSKSNGKVKSGDVIEIYAGIACLSELEEPVGYKKFMLLYDKEILGVVDEHNPHQLRDGWNFMSAIHDDGELQIETVASDDANRITREITSEYCNDLVNAVLVTYKLKVKDVPNQKIKIKLIDENNYVEELSFEIYNSSKNNYLSSLKVENFELETEFNKNKNDYEVYVPYATEKVNLVATVEDSKASLSGIGEKELVVGDNKFELEVTAENGDKKTYTVDVIRKKADDNTALSKFSVKDSNNKHVSLNYDSTKKTYTGDVSNDVIFVSFDMECSGEGCYVDKLGALPLIEGNNSFKFTVVSQNGNREVYTVDINREVAVKEKDYTVLLLSVALGFSLAGFILLLILYIKRVKK